MSSSPVSKRLGLTRLSIALVLAILLAWAGLVKLTGAAAFSDTLNTYALLPARVLNLVALGLPVLEIIAAVALLIPASRRIGALLSAILSLSFALALSSALQRGLNVDCGCFGSASFLNLSPPWALARSVVLLLASIWLYVQLRPRTSP
jgi:putative oxidoreductase